MAIDASIVINGLFSLLFVVFSLIIGLKIALKYKEIKQRVFPLIGISWFVMSKPWWGSSISFLAYLFNGVGIPLFWYILITFSFISVILILWLIALNDLTQIKNFKVIYIIFIIYAVIFESLILYFLFTDISVLAVMIDPVNVDLGLFLIIYLLIELIIFIISGLFFSIISLKSEEPKVKLKGKFLLLAFLIYLIGAALETILSFPPFRLILIISALFFYIGFMMPEVIEKKFLKGS
ncbi:MAG: hypothetical protein EU539_10505 [Promethearchaeota archaeon]|nr:MAG: hypothetical protein EU539_10505 [Candidatus Lokiarchaeota archaeon]